MLKNLFAKKVKTDHVKEMADWEKQGRPFPPPHIVKQNAITEYQQRYDIGTLVETGTYLGDMVEAQKNNFSRIYSIELSKKLHKRATKKFRKEEKIILLQGDSGVKITEVISALNAPAIFWLDGHYSGGITALGDKECPVIEELSAIFKSTIDHLVLIDDARLFNGTHDYPSLEEVKRIMENSRHNYGMEVGNDIIRLIPKKK